MLNLMYITNRPEIAIAAENAGVDRIFVDFEYIGKDQRQHDLNTVKNHHTPEDVRKIRNVISKAQLLVRVNPIHNGCAMYSSSKEEIDAAIENGADVIMLPYFKSVDEVKQCIDIINGRVLFCPLLETPEAVECIDELLRLDGIDEIHVGINDLSLGYHQHFMFELLIDGTVENLCKKFHDAGIPYGFGGIASLHKGLVPAEYIIARHYELGSSKAILSRSFYNIQDIENIDEVADIFMNGVRDIRQFEKECQYHLEQNDTAFFDENRRKLQEGVERIVKLRSINL